MTFANLAQSKKLSKHLFVSLLLSGIPYLLFIMLRAILSDMDVFPDRDQMSAYTHLAAFLIITYRTVRLGEFKRNWIYLLIVAISLVMFLEESEFLSEISLFGRNFYFQYRPEFVKPYLEKYALDLRWRSFHNFFYFIFSQWWQEYFDRDLLARVFSLDALFTGVTLLYVLLRRLPSTIKNQSSQIVRSYGLTAIAVSLFGLGLLVRAGKSSGWLDSQGLDLSGQITAGAIVLIPIFIGVALLRSGRENGWLNRALEKLSGSIKHRVVSLASVALLGLGLLAMQISFSHFEHQFNMLERVFGISLAAILIGQLMLIGLLIIDVDAFLTWPLKKYWNRLRGFLINHPSFFYLAAYLGIMLFAQLFDWDILSREGQPLIREEVIEWVSAFQLLMTGLLIPGRKKIEK